MKYRNKGFTLIELLIVVVVIAILAAIAIPSLFQTKERSFIVTMKSDLRNLSSAQEAYFSDWQRYSSSLADLGTLFINSPSVGVAIDSASGTGWGATATFAATTKVCSVAVTLTSAGTPTCP
jgi:prepilin-type N-terminal cleavage/methylation domain-containing protein